MHTESDCLFCQIVAGTMPAAKVIEDELTCVFMDIFPVAPGHTLIIPKAHVANIYEVSDAGVAAVAQMARRVARAIQHELEPAGLQVFQLNGPAAGQTIFHYHTHLLPRQPGDPLSLHARKRADDEELKRLAARLRAALE